MSKLLEILVKFFVGAIACGLILYMLIYHTAIYAVLFCLLIAYTIGSIIVDEFV